MTVLVPYKKHYYFRFPNLILEMMADPVVFPSLRKRK